MPSCRAQGRRGIGDGDGNFHLGSLSLEDVLPGEQQWELLTPAEDLAMSNLGNSPACGNPAGRSWWCWALLGWSWFYSIFIANAAGFSSEHP